MRPRTRLQQAMLTTFVALACAGSAFASATARGDCPDPTREEREKMAAAHEQMAACLRSEKAFSECHKEMMNGEHQMMRKMGCPGNRMRPHDEQKPRPKPSMPG